MPADLNVTRAEAAERSRLVSVDGYDVALDLTTDPHTFDCITTVAFGCRTPGSSTWIDLVAPEVTSVNLNGRELDPQNVFDGARIQLDDLESSNVLIVHAKCAFMHTGEGLHRFVDPVDDEVYLYTQFESADARRMYACFEQPDLKAPFTLHVTAPDHWQVVSNAPTPEPVMLGDGTARWDFEPTPPISTYITALVAGPYYVVRDAYEGKFGAYPLGIFCRASLAEFLDPDDIFLLTKQGFAFFEDEFGIPYPFGKYDQLFVPEFNAGAMENAACVTFLEDMVFRSRVTDAAYEQRANTILHEMAHMWFGDLVTMRWWNGLWLNEAFATFMEVTASDAFQPDWDCWTGFGLLRSAAFDTDSLQTTRPIEYPVVTAADAEGMFDVLTYEKGASIVRMLEQYLRPERFRAGIAEYLRRHEFSNTDTGDLWDAIEATAGEPVRSIMDAWIFRGGHPEVAVEFTDTGVTLHQHRFRFDDAGPGSDETWPIPMVVTTSRAGIDRSHRLVLGERAELDLGGPPEWIQPNTWGDGFFRTRLPVAGALALVEAGRPPLERFMLLDDLWAAILAGRAEPSDALALIERLSPIETNPSVWRRIAGILGDVDRLAGPDTAAAARATAVAVANERLDAIGAEVARTGEPTDERVRSIRSVCFALAGSVGADATVQATARQLFHDGVGDASLRSASTDVVAHTASHDEHAAIEQRWRSAASPQDELRYLHALADTPDLTDLERTLELALSDVRPQNQPYLLRRALTNVHHGSRTWSFVTDRWSELTASISTIGMTRLLEGIRSFDDAALAAAAEAFISEHRPDDPSPVVDQHLERMWVNVRAAERLRRVD